MVQMKNTPIRIPRFADDESAAVFFETHDTSRIWEQMKPAKPLELLPEQVQAMRERYRQRALSQLLGLNARQVAQSRSIARRKAVAVETQLRRWIAEGIRRESGRVRSRNAGEGTRAAAR
jgi:hypothetical protein